MKRSLASLLAGAFLLLAAASMTPWGQNLAFYLGGGMAALGQRLQESRVGLGGDDSPGAILATVLRHNSLSSSMRRAIPGRTTHPEVIAVMCMDPRLKESFIFGDTRQMYDVIRLPGSVLSPETIEAIELAVREHRVKLVLLTSHTDCAMEAIARSEHADEFPALSRAVHRREEGFQTLLARPIIAAAIAAGRLRVARFTIDTTTGRLLPSP